MTTTAIVIGNGVDALVAAQYLRRAGHTTVVCAQPRQSGAFEPGWVPPRIVRDLGLERHGFEIKRTDPWASVPLGDGERLELTHDVTRSAEAIRRLSMTDAAKWPDFCARMHRLARLLESIYSAAPPDPMTLDFGGYAQLARLGLRVRGLGKQGMDDLFRLLPMPVADLLDDWFECDALKGVLGAAGVMHFFQGPRSGGTAYAMLHHHVGCAPGVFRPPLSNIGPVLTGLAGVEKREDPVAHINVQANRVTGVVLASGVEVATSLVVCGLTPQRTLLELIDPGWLDPELVRAVRRIRSRGVVAGVTLTLDRDPGFSTLVVSPSLDYLERAYDDAKHGHVSREPYIEAKRAAADSRGQHRVEAHVQYAPYSAASGLWTYTQRNDFARGVIERLAQHVPGLTSSVFEHDVRSAEDFEDACAFPQGQAYHAELALDQALWMRPVPQLAQYRTPIRGLYLCGPAMHPGAGTAGAAGANAAHQVLRDLRKGLLQ